MSSSDEDEILGEAKRKTTKKAVLRIRTDTKGKYVVIKGVKYRLGRNVSNAQLAKFVRVKSAKKPSGTVLQFPTKAQSIKDREAISRINNFVANETEQKVRDRREEEQREKPSIDIKTRTELPKKLELANTLRELPLDDLATVASDLYITRKSNIKPPVTGKENIIKYIVDNAGYKFSVSNALNRELDTSIPPTSNIANSDFSGILHDYLYGPEMTGKDEDELVIRTIPGVGALSVASTDDLRTYIKRRRSHIDVSSLPRKDLIAIGLDIRNKSGRGKSNEERGMSNFQIDDILSKYPDYLGCVSHDEIKSLILPKIKPKSKGGFIINTEPHNKPGQHWQAIYFDATPGGQMEIDWYDSYGDPIDPQLQADLVNISKKLDAGTYLKLKENRVKYQNSKSSNCGPFAVSFLIDRFRGKPFVDASGWSDTIRGEGDIEDFKRRNGIRLGGFRYVESFGGSIGLPVLRDDYPPAVRKYLTDTPITSMSICRKPISGSIDNLLNVVSLGGWATAKKQVGINQALHLYMVLNGDTILERNHVISMRPGHSDKDSECMEVDITHPITFADLLTKTKNAIGGPELNRYDGRDNNCQVFLTQVMRSNGLLTPELNSFTNQDIKGVFEHLPGFVHRLSQIVTDTAHRADTAIHGKRKKTLDYMD